MPPDVPLRLPPGYELKEEQPDFLMLRREDGTMVETFPFSVSGPNPDRIRKAAEADYRKLVSRGQGYRSLRRA